MAATNPAVRDGDIPDPEIERLFPIGAFRVRGENGPGRRPRSPGFTLVEVIIVITLGALIAAMMGPFVGTSMTRSSEPVNQISEGLEIGGVMAEILAAYRDEVRQEGKTLEEFQSRPADFQRDGVTVSTAYVEFERPSDTAYQDTNGDGVFDPTVQGGTYSDGYLLRVTAEKNGQTQRLLLGKAE